MSLGTEQMAEHCLTTRLFLLGYFGQKLHISDYNPLL